MRATDINIVFMSNVPFPNGTASTRFVQQYADFFFRRGASVSVLVLRGRPLLPGNEAESGVYHGVPYRVIGRDLRLGLRFAACWRAFIYAGRAFLHGARRTDRVNVLYHYGQPDPESLGFLHEARRLGYVVVSSIAEDYRVCHEDVGVLHRLKQRVVNTLDRRIARYTHGIGVLSTRLEEKYHNRGVPLALIPVATELRSVAMRVGYHAPVRLFYAGTFGRKDGVEDLLHAFHRLRQERGEVGLWLAGQCDRRAERRLAPHGLDGPGVHRTGFLPDDEFDRLVDESDILCMTRVDSPFANAGFPFKLARYLASGNPVVATLVSDVGRYLEDGRDARLVPPGDLDRLTDALRWLVDHPAAARSIGVRGRTTCERHFDIERTGEQWIDLIRRVCQVRGVSVEETVG